MKRYEKLAIDFAKRYRTWDAQCVSKDTYLEAYKQAIKDAQLYIDDSGQYNDVSDMVEYTNSISYVGKEMVEVEFNNGEHQLTDDIK